MTVSLNVVGKKRNFYDDEMYMNTYDTREYDVCSDCARDVVDMFNETKAITVESGIRL